MYNQFLVKFINYVADKYLYNAYYQDFSHNNENVDLAIFQNDDTVIIV